MTKRARPAARPLRSHPTPNQIADAPELAILCALDEVLDLACRALIAAHPVLGETDAPYWAHEATRQSRTAKQLLAKAHRLRRSVRAYRTATQLARDALQDRESELPF
jgi:hypothetical protein